MKLKRSASQAIASRGATGMNVSNIGIGATGMNVRNIGMGAPDYQIRYYRKPLPISFLISMAFCFFIMGFSLGLLFK